MSDDELAEIARLQAAGKALLSQALDHDDYVLIHRTDWSDFRSALAPREECEWCRGWDEVFACAHCGRSDAIGPQP